VCVCVCVLESLTPPPPPPPSLAFRFVFKSALRVREWGDTLADTLNASEMRGQRCMATAGARETTHDSMLCTSRPSYSHLPAHPPTLPPTHTAAHPPALPPTRTAAHLLAGSEQEEGASAVGVARRASHPVNVGGRALWAVGLHPHATPTHVKTNERGLSMPSARVGLVASGTVPAAPLLPTVNTLC
jgi:hypothetical protein